MRSGDPGPDRPWRMPRVGPDLLFASQEVCQQRSPAVQGRPQDVVGCDATPATKHGAYLFTAANLGMDVIVFLRASPGWQLPSGRRLPYELPACPTFARMAGFGAIEPSRVASLSAYCCPTPAVRNTRRDRLSWVDSGHSVPCFAVT